MKKSLIVIVAALFALYAFARVMICESNEMSLDVTVGDTLSIEPYWHAERPVAMRLSTVWYKNANGILSINGVEETRVPEDLEEYFYLKIPVNSGGIYNCVFAMGDEVYKRTLVITGVRQLKQSGSAMLDTYSSPRVVEARSVVDIRYSNS